MWDSSISMRIIEVATSAGLATLAIFLILRRYIVKGLTQDQQVEIERVRAEAALEAREEAMRLREEIEEEAKQQRHAAEKLQQALAEKDSQLETRRESLVVRERELNDLSLELTCREQSINKKAKQYQEQLSKIAGLDKETARELFLKEI